MATSSTQTSTVRQGPARISWQTTTAGIAAGVAILAFVLDRFFGVQVPESIQAALGVLLAALLPWLGVSARDNRVTSEDVGLKDRVVGTVGPGSTIELAKPVEIVEPEPQTTPEPAVAAKDPAQ